ncbi:MAG: site-2 protease family protein [Alphaproteobacteria bacterium]|nr:site-2 protease family protein [Alphaproteobacteria bacterium]
MGIDFDAILTGLSVWALPVIIAITFHEAAHGYVAWRLGDPTAFVKGRVTFNPFKHIDPVGTILIPAVLLIARSPFIFGYAKPVPVNFSRLKHPRRDMILVAAAGPGTNLGLALISAALIHIIPILPLEFGQWVFENLRNSLIINLVLAVFNMFPIPPLDGGRVAVGLLPDAMAFRLARLERVGLVLIIGILFLAPMVTNAIGLDFNPIEYIILVPVSFLAEIILNLVGLS